MDDGEVGVYYRNLWVVGFNKTFYIYFLWIRVKKDNEKCKFTEIEVLKLYLNITDRSNILKPWNEILSWLISNVQVFYRYPIEILKSNVWLKFQINKIIFQFKLFAI